MRRAGFAGGLGYAGESIVVPDPDDDPIIQWAWAGNVTDDSAEITARCSTASSVQLRYSVNSDLSGYSTVAGVEGADDVFRFAISGLSDDTLYYYGFTGSSLTGQFRSFPSAASTFSIALASCSNTNAITFDRIADRDLLFFWHLGDRHYADVSVNTAAAFRTAYANVMARSREHAMHLKFPVAYTWNDHDFGGNDSWGGDIAKPSAQQVYREHVPHWPLPADTRPGGDGEIYQTFVAGRVRFILLDDRSERSHNNATNNSSKTMLGADQKAWFKETLLAATEPLIVVHVGSPWNATGSITWSVFSTERDELTTFFSENSLTDRLLIVHGDHHWMAADDGTNSPGGIPCVAAAPLSQNYTSSSGTWTTGIKKVQPRQYCTIEFDDDGTDIAVTVKGWSVTSAGVETEQFSLALAY